MLTALVAHRGARGADETYVGASGNWSDNRKWLDGTAPPAGGDPALMLRFSRAATATNDLGAFQLNRLRTEPFLFGTLTIASAPGSSLRFVGAQPAIESVNIGDVVISSPVTLSPASGDVLITGDGPGFLTLSGPIGEDGVARKMVLDSSVGSVSDGIVALSAVNTFTGGFSLRAGNLRLDNANALGTGPLEIRGGTLRLDASGALANPIVLHDHLVITSAAGGRIAGVISGAVPGAGLMLRNRSSDLTLTGPSTYTGPTVVDYGIVPGDATGAGRLLLSGNGSVLNSSSIEVRAGGRFSTSSNGGATDRIGDSTPVKLRNGTFGFSGGASADTQTETVGPLTGAGFSTIFVSANAVGGSTRLYAPSLERIERGTFLLRGANLGGAFGTGTGNLLLGTAPTGMIGGGGAGPSVSILPYAINATTSTSFGDTFTTWESGTGFRPLNAASEYTATLSSAAPGDNVRIAGSAQTLSGSQTVNSLVLASGGSLNGGGTLTLTSGALLGAGNSPLNVTLDVNLAFGAAEANVFNVGPLTIGRMISGSNGLTKSGSGVMTLSGNNTFTGPLTINSGLMSFASLANFGSDTSPITFGGTGAGLSYAGTTNLNLDRDLVLGSGIAAFNITAAQRPRLTLAGTISGAGGMSLTTPARGGTPNFAITGANTYTGPTLLGANVRVLIGSDAALGNGGPVEMASGSAIQLGGPWQTARPLSLAGLSFIDTAGFDATLSGPLSGNGALSKLGAGTLRLTQNSPLRGTVVASGGRLELAESGAVSSSVVRVSGGAELRLDNTASAVSQRLRTGSMSLNDADFNLLGNAAVNVQQDVSSLAVAQQSRLTLTAPGAAQTIVKIGELRLADGATAPTLLVRGDNLGGGAGGGFTRVSVDSIIPFFNAPTGFGIVPGVYLGGSSTGVASSFAINDAGTDAAGQIGLRALRPEEYATGTIRNPTNGGGTPVGAHQLVESGTVASGAANTVATLTFQPAGTLALAPEQSLVVDAGSILARGGGAAGEITGGTLVFGSASPAIYTAGDLRIESSLAGTATLQKLGAGALILATSTPAAFGVAVQEGTLRAGADLSIPSLVTLSGGAALDITGRMVALGALGNDGAGAGEVRLGGGTLTLGTALRETSFSGVISGAGQLIIEGGPDGRGRHSLTGANTFGGGVTLAGGRLTINSSTAVGSGPITAAGGALAGSSDLALTNALILNEDLPIEGTGTITFGPSSVISGTGGLELRGSSNLVLATASMHTGETRVAAGRTDSGTSPGSLTVSGAAGAIAASSALRVGGTLVLDNTTAFAGGTAGRVGDAAPVALEGGLLTLAGNASEATTETVGPLSGRGFSLVNFATLATAGTRLNAASLTREERGTFFFSGRLLGSAPGAGVSNLFFAQPPPGLVGGGGTGPATSILPYAVSDIGAGNQLVTYDATTGIRPLEFAEYQANAFNSPTDNVRITVSTTVAAPVTANAIVLSGGAALFGAGSLRVTSGALLKSAGLNASIANPLDFGTAEANVSVQPGAFSTETLTLSGPVSGSGGVTKSGSGTLLLSGTNSFTGPLTVNEGTIEFLTSAGLGPETSAIVFNGGFRTPGLRYGGTTPLTFARELHTSSGLFQLSARGTLTVAGDIVGPGGVVIGAPNTADAFVVFAGAKSYTGTTVIAGPLAIASDASLGVGGDVILGGVTGARLRLEGPWITDREIHAAGVAFDTNGFDAQWRGPLRADPARGGSFSKIGAGTLTIGDARAYGGGLTIDGGMVAIESAVAAGPQIIVGISGRLLASDRFARTVQVRGALAPGGDSIGTLDTNGVLFDAQSTLELELQSSARYDRVGAAGDVNIASGANLSLKLDFDPVDFVDSFEIVQNDGSDLVSFFATGFAVGGNALDEGGTFFAGTQEFRISYRGGTGNDVVLYAVPEPGAVQIAVAACCLVALRRQRRAISASHCTQNESARRTSCC